MKRERTNPREIEGKQALFVVNLPPRKMAGMVSEGMLFDIGYSDGIMPVLATLRPVPDGTRADDAHRYTNRASMWVAVILETDYVCG
jgi:tRNA-binding EMAP/Myf-like protein